jgi:type II secretory pathway component PulF
MAAMVTPGQLNRRAELFAQLAATISAGIPLPKALEMASRNRSTGIPQRALQQITEHLQEGHTFTDAVLLVSGQKRDANVLLKPGRKFSFWLSDFDIALLSAGEETGRLDMSFKLLSRYYASRAKIIRDTITKLIITIMTLHVFLLIIPLGFLIGFVLGIVNNDFSRCLPFIIEKIAVFGGGYGLLWLFVYACQGNRGEGWRAVLERFFTAVPMLGKALKYLAVARLAMALDALLNAGVPIVKSWNIAAAACGSPHLKREILKWTPELERRTTPAEMVSQIRYFPEMFQQLVQTGEISGRMDESLVRLNEYFEDEGFRKLGGFCTLLNYLIYFTIAGMVGWFVISFWMGYYSKLLGSV